MATSNAVSARKIEANRRNARKSTGPRTAEGKARSSRNAVTHGLFCTPEQVVLPGESAEAYAALRRELIEEHRPQTITELFMVDRMALSMWRLRRIADAEQLAHAAVGEEMREAHVELLKSPDAREKDDDDDGEWDDDDDDDDDDEADRDRGARELRLLARAMSRLPVPPPAAVTTYGLIQPRGGLPNKPGLLERLNLYERRVEGTMHRCLRDLRKLRTPAKNERVPDEPSPYLSAAIEEEAELKAATEPSLQPSPVVPGKGEEAAATANVSAAEALAGEGVAIATSNVKNEATAGEAHAHPLASEAPAPSAAGAPADDACRATFAARLSPPRQTCENSGLV